MSSNVYYISFWLIKCNNLLQHTYITTTKIIHNFYITVVIKMYIV